MAFSRSNLCQNCINIFPCELGTFTQFCIWPHPSSLFVEQDSLFCPFRRTHRRESVRLCSNYQYREQVPELRPILISTRAAEACATEGSTQRRRPRGIRSLQRQRHSLPITIPGYESTSSRDSLLLTFHIAGELDPTVPTSKRYRGWEQNPERAFWESY